MNFDFTQPPYQRLRSIVAERTTKVVAWVGAGLSVPAGLPTWSGLHQKLLAALESKAANLVGRPKDEALAKHAAAQLSENFWTAFHILQEGLGSTSYRQTVREALSVADTAPVPHLYEALWRLGPAGCVSLNLDRFPVRAFSSLNPGKTLHEFGGRTAGSSLHLVKNPHPWVASLHGVHSDEKSWVFTSRDLSSLMNDEGYRVFVTTLFTSSTVLFVGISADDIAAGGHLDALTGKGIDTGEHFWITDRRDAESEKWAEAAGISIIRYLAPNHDHSALDSIFSDLSTYKPLDDTNPAPIKPTVSITPPSDELEDPEILAQKQAETIRRSLNLRAEQILSAGSPEAYTAYSEFCSRYDEAIYRAWYVSANPPNNVLLGYRLLRQLDKGAFGTVYLAESPNGENVALKLLHESVRNSRPMLQSFRRGVRSMRILSESHLRGMVPYISASEIPAFVVMNYVQGVNLRQAVEGKMIATWDDVLDVAVELARIIAAAHALPDRVLHRDIRPSNVMLPMTATEEDRLVVLDFDLSWHRGAQEASVHQQPGALGYLAPEQVGLAPNVSTRHSAVDSFGLGMTLFYIVGGREPQYANQRHASWLTDLRSASSRPSEARWKSLPSRFARLIYNSTLDVQSARWDIARIHAELERLKAAQLTPTETKSSELLAEEIAFLALNSHYTWNEDRLSARHALPSGTVVSLKSNETNARIDLTLEWNRAGSEERRAVSKWLRPACDQALSTLQRAAWRKNLSSVNNDAAVIEAHISTTDAAVNIETASRALRDAIDKLRFS